MRVRGSNPLQAELGGIRGFNPKQAELSRHLLHNNFSIRVYPGSISLLSESNRTQTTRLKSRD